jgi:nicotinamidase-related amidase
MMIQMKDRPNTALLVIDVQNDVMATAHNRDVVVTNIKTLVDEAREEGVCVIWVQHDDEGLPLDTYQWQIVPELTPLGSEPHVRKTVRDSFEGTTLEDELASRNVGRLVMTGAQTDFCVRWTLHGAHARGYDTVLVADAHTTDESSPSGMPNGAELIAHTNSIWASQVSPGRTSEVLPTADVDFSALPR